MAERWDRTTGRPIVERHEHRVDVDEVGDERVQCDGCGDWFEPDDLDDGWLCWFCAQRQRRVVSVPPSGVCLWCGYPTARDGGVCLRCEETRP